MGADIRLQHRWAALLTDLGLYQQTSGATARQSSAWLQNHSLEGTPLPDFWSVLSSFSAIFDRKMQKLPPFFVHLKNDK